MRSIVQAVFAASVLVNLTACCCPCCCGGGGGGGGGSTSSGSSSSSATPSDGPGWGDALLEDLGDKLEKKVQEELGEALVQEMIESQLEGQLEGEVEFDLDAGTFEFVQKDGTRLAVDVEDAQWLESFPLVKQYPGSKVLATFGADGPGLEGAASVGAIIGSSADSDATVIAHYEPVLSKLDRYEKQTNPDNKSVVMLGYLEDGRVVVVSVSTDSKGETTITYVVVKDLQQAP